MYVQEDAKVASHKRRKGMKRMATPEPKAKAKAEAWGKACKVYICIGYIRHIRHTAHIAYLAHIPEALYTTTFIQYITHVTEAKGKARGA